MVFRSPYPDIHIPEISLSDFVLRRVARGGSRPALIDATTEQTLAYSDLLDRIYQSAARLAQKGLRKGEVVAIYSSNRPEYAIAFHAICLIGGVTTTVNPLYTPDELRNQLKDANARFLITGIDLVERARQASAGSRLEEILTFEESFAFSKKSDVPAVKINSKEDLVALPYSSGTTGFPKGVMLTHYNMIANLLQFDATRQIAEGDTVLCVLPMFHIYGLVGIMNLGLYKRATIVTMPRFDLEQYLQNIEKYRVTFAHVVPPIVLALAKNPIVSHYDLSSLRRIFCAAAPLSPKLLQEGMERIGCLIKQGYGMTEASPATHMCPDEPAIIKHGSVGLCVPNTECQVMDPVTKAELGPNQKGEICIRGPQIMKGYLNRPDDTALAIDPKGWLHTGDIGYADKDGNLYIVDRLKELIKYKGFQVAPAELEAVLLTHPCVADAAVIPVADEEGGEIPKAFIVLKQQAAADEILTFVAERVAPYKKIRKLEILEQIPKSPSGKILRRVLIEREKQN